MTEETHPYRKIWASVVLLAIKDKEALEALDDVPPSEMNINHVKKRRNILNWGTPRYPTPAGGSPAVWLKSDYCGEIMSMIGIRR